MKTLIICMTNYTIINYSTLFPQGQQQQKITYNQQACQLGNHV